MDDKGKVLKDVVVAVVFFLIVVHIICVESRARRENMRVISLPLNHLPSLPDNYIFVMYVAVLSVYKAGGGALTKIVSLKRERRYLFDDASTPTWQKNRRRLVVVFAR